MAKTDEEIEYDLLCENTRELLKLRSGRDFIWHVLGLCDLYTDKFTGNSTTFMLLGKTAVGLEILSLLEDVDPTAYPTLLLERAKNVKEDKP